MCFELDSAPPVPALSGAAVSHDDLVLEAADGNRFAAFAAVPEESGGPGVVVLPDVRGLYRFYEELALRFGERGIHAVAIDYFGRSAGVGKRGDDFPYMEHVAETTPEDIQADVRAAVEHLRSASGAIITVGFCFGGRQSWLAAAGGHGLAGAVGFYGRPGLGNDGSPGPIQRARELAAPILALQAGDDQNITAADNAAFEQALTAAGVEHGLVTYEGAPHSFFDRRHEEFADASADAWRRVLDFVGRYS
ncbi:MAG TPA: dienelactone hydrolase family protein [Gaiellaceae bacterium]|jgi:carboxymethylenebutenolidase|nr:dienelactone hydrolase family protein [Gaiellaceae bacterium]